MFNIFEYLIEYLDIQLGSIVEALLVTVMFLIVMSLLALYFKHLDKTERGLKEFSDIFEFETCSRGYVIYLDEGKPISQGRPSSF